jgi:hypothetical protein
MKIAAWKVFDEMPLINQPQNFLHSRSSHGNRDTQDVQELQPCGYAQILWVDVLNNELTSMLWFPMAFMVCQFLLFNQIWRERTTEVIEKKKNFGDNVNT